MNTPKHPHTIETSVEISFDNSQMHLYFESTNGAPLNWEHIEQAIKDIKHDFDFFPNDGEVH